MVISYQLPEMHNPGKKEGRSSYFTSHHNLFHNSNVLLGKLVNSLGGTVGVGPPCFHCQGPGYQSTVKNKQTKRKTKQHLSSV